MTPTDRVRSEDYVDVSYLQFTKSKTFYRVERFFGILVWPLVWPLAMLSRRSEILFRTLSELFSIVPYAFGIIFRYEFYRFVLDSIGRNVQIEFGAILVYPNISIGDNVLIGRYTIVHHCDIGDFVLIGERCTLLSGSRQHSFERADVPMALQGGRKKRITLGRDAWIGSHAVVMEDVQEGSIVAAAAVVTKPVPAGTIVAGNPASAVGRRGE